jgi:hypothetical protein
MKTGRPFLMTGLLLLTLSALSQVMPPPPPPPSPPSMSMNRADSLFREGNITGAITEYVRMLKANPDDHKTAYNYACALSRGNQTDSALKYLYQVVESDPSVTPLSDPDLLNVREDKRWSDFENRVIVLMNQKGNSIKDPEYAKVLLKLLCMDQYCFYETGIAVRKLGPASPVVSALRKLQAMINEKNLKGLEELLSSRGWPKRSLVGPEAAGAAFFILQHSNAEAQQKYIPLFEKCCRENEGDWNQYALMFDRMRMNQHKPQRFGTHAYLDPSAGSTNELYPLEDESRVDEWRKEIGLEPLADYLKRTGIKKGTSTVPPK